MELHGGHLHRPHHAGQFGHAQLVGVPAVAGEVHPHRLQPRRRTVRNPLLVDLLPGNPGREPVHHARPLTQRPHDAVADRQVIADQVQLGLSASREVHPARIGDPHRPVPDLELHLICSHGKKLTREPGRGGVPQMLPVNQRISPAAVTDACMPASCRSAVRRACGVGERTRYLGQEAADGRRGALAHGRPVQPGATRPGCGQYAPARASAVTWSPAGTSIRSASRAVNSLPSAAMASQWIAIWAQSYVSARWSRRAPASRVGQPPGQLPPPGR